MTLNFCCDFWNMAECINLCGKGLMAPAFVDAVSSFGQFDLVLGDSWWSVCVLAASQLVFFNLFEDRLGICSCFPELHVSCRDVGGKNKVAVRQPRCMQAWSKFGFVALLLHVSNGGLIPVPTAQQRAPLSFLNLCLFYFKLTFDINSHVGIERIGYFK